MKFVYVCRMAGSILNVVSWAIISTSGMTNLLPPRIRTPDLPAHSLFLTRPQIVSCRHYCSYHCDLNVQEWWTSEQIKNTYCCHRHTFAEYTAFALPSSCVWKHQWKTKCSALQYPVPSQPPPEQLGPHLIDSGCEVMFFRQHRSSVWLTVGPDPWFC